MPRSSVVLESVLLQDFFDAPLDFIRRPHVALPKMNQPAIGSDQGGAQVVIDQAADALLHQAKEGADGIGLFDGAGAEGPGVIVLGLACSILL